MLDKLGRFAVWAAIALIGFGWLFSGSEKSATANVAPSAPTGGLSEITLSGLRWTKGGFGSVMEASFSVTNRNRYAIKDVQVTCYHSANSGTVIDSNTRVLFEAISAGGSILVHDLNMGFIHSQVSSSRCGITDFKPA